MLCNLHDIPEWSEYGKEKESVSYFSSSSDCWPFGKCFLGKGFNLQLASFITDSTVHVHGKCRIVGDFCCGRVAYSTGSHNEEVLVPTKTCYHTKLLKAFTMMAFNPQGNSFFTGAHMRRNRNPRTPHTMSTSLVSIDKTPASCAVSTDSTTVLPLTSCETITKRPIRPATIAAAQPEKFEDLIDGYGQQFHVPDYTVNDIRKAIPKDCFQRSALRGLAYVARDIGLITGTFYFFNEWLDVNSFESLYLRCSLWSLYGFLNGLFGTGIWVLAHECGHQALSRSKVLNDTVGFVLHSSLLVPYFSWKISHGKHHKATAHMERDMVFVPRTRQEHCNRFGTPTEHLHEIVQDTPLYAAYYIVTRLLFGWPTYLLTNDTGHNYHERQPEGRGIGKRNGLLTGVNHFNPSSPLFENRDAKWIFVSDLGILSIAILLYFVGLNCGWINLFKWYFVPYLWVNSWLGKR